jgi:hypothetical protein
MTLCGNNHQGLNRAFRSELDIHRKPTYTDMIHYTSNHPYIHKLPAFIFYTNRMITMPITHHTIGREWHKMLKMTQNIGFPKQIIYELKERLITNKRKATHTPHNNKVTDGLPSHFTVLPCIRSQIYLKKMV